MIIIVLLIIAALVIYFCRQRIKNFKTKPSSSPKGSKRNSPMNSSIKRKLGLMVYDKRDGSVIQKDPRYDSKQNTDSPNTKRSKEYLPELKQRKQPQFDSRDPSRNKNLDRSLETRKPWNGNQNQTTIALNETLDRSQNNT